MTNTGTVEPQVDQGQNHQLAAGAGQRIEVEPDDSIDVLDILVVLAQGWRRIALLSCIGLILGVILSLVLRPTYKGSALILPPQQEHSISSALAGQLGALASLGGGGGGGLLKNPADMYVGILESRTIADELIAKFHLQALYKEKTMAATRDDLKRHTTFEAGKDGLIHIAVEDHDPQRASDLTNGYLDALYRMNSTLAITEAAQRRVFFDEQLAEEKSALLKAEDALKQTEEKTGLIQLNGQAQAIISSIAQARAQISSLEVELQATRTFATDQNPDAVRIQQEIATRQRELAQLESSQAKLAPGDIALPAGRVPQAGLEFASKVRDLKYHETLYDLLSRQYEAARIDEAKSAPILQVVDRAVPPDKKSGPHRLLILAGLTFLGFVMGCLCAFLRQAMLRMQSEPETAMKLAQMRSALRS